MGDNKKVIYRDNKQTIYIDPSNHKRNSFEVKNREKYKIHLIDGRPLEIMTISNKNNYSFNFNHQYPVSDYYFLSENRLLKPNDMFSVNTPHRYLIPGKYNEGTIEFSSLESNFNIPINNFVSESNLDPLKLFYFTPENHSVSNIILNDAIDLRGFPLTDQYNDNMLFIQELDDDFKLSEGVNLINDLNETQSYELLKTIIGDDHIKDLEDQEKDGVSIWSKKKVAKDAAKTVYKLTREDTRKILSDFGTKGKFYFKKVGGKKYVIFKGYKGVRNWYTGTRYKAANPKVISLTYGGGVKQVMKSSYSIGTRVSILIVGGIEIIDYMLKDENERFIGELAGALAFETLKTVVGAVITAGIASAALATITALWAVTIPVWVVVGGTIALGIAVGYALTWLDKQFGVKETFKKKGKDMEDFLGELYDEYFFYPLLNIYHQLNKSIEGMYYRRIGGYY
jgi:hypothetical protein